VGGHLEFALARYNPDGGLDGAFGSGGKVTTDFSGFNSAVEAVALQAGGKIVAVGYAAHSSGVGGFAVARSTSDGTLDGTFGSGGKVTTDFGGYDVANTVAIRADGRIVAGGTTAATSTSARMIALAMYNPDGSPDADFNVHGTVITYLSDDET